MSDRMIAGLEHPIKIGNIIGNQINPATEESLSSLSSQASSFAGLAIPECDAIYATYPTDSSEVYTYKLVGVTVAVLTVTYTNSAKTTLTSAVIT